MECFVQEEFTTPCLGFGLQRGMCVPYADQMSLNFIQLPSLYEIVYESRLYRV